MYHYVSEAEIRFAVHIATEHGDIVTEFFSSRENAEEFARNCAEEEPFEDAFVSELVSTHRAPDIPPAPAGVPDPYGWEAIDAYQRRKPLHPFAA